MKRIVILLVGALALAACETSSGNYGGGEYSSSNY